eukprot:scaffold3_cov273-Pinguiococcus_pyrenoidosus.AAC.15
MATRWEVSGYAVLYFIVQLIVSIVLCRCQRATFLCICRAGGSCVIPVHPSRLLQRLAFGPRILLVGTFVAHVTLRFLPEASCAVACGGRKGPPRNRCLRRGERGREARSVVSNGPRFASSCHERAPDVPHAGGIRLTFHLPCAPEARHASVCWPAAASAAADPSAPRWQTGKRRQTQSRSRSRSRRHVRRFRGSHHLDGHADDIPPVPGAARI